MSRFAVLSLAVAAFGNANAASVQAAANPIRKVVNMLTALKDKVDSEGEKEEDLYNKYMCYCKTGAATLEESVAAAETKVPELEAAINESAAQKAQLEEDLVNHKADREAAKASMAEATAIREKEAAAFAELKATYGDDLKAMETAIAAIEKGTGGSFLQTNAKASSALRKALKHTTDMLDEDRQQVLAFLQAPAGEYVPQSGQIVGILKQMSDTMFAGLKEAEAAEATAIEEYAALMAAKKKEVAALTAAIEEKSVRVGELGVAIAEMKVEMGDTAEALAEDKKFLADMEKNCATKTEEWDAIVKMRAQELVALSETIKVLNDDDALDLFKKTLPSSAASFVQVVDGVADVKQRALAALRGAGGSHNSQLELISLAINGKKIGFEKILTMIDELVVLLKKEQKDDDDKKAYCETELDVSDDKKKALENSVSDAETAIADAEETIKTLTEEIAALEAGIKALDKSVAEATEQRKSENEDFKELMSSNGMAKDLINFAKNRLNKFYNPKLYVPPPKQELSAEDAIATKFGGTAPPTPAPGGIAGTGIGAFVEIHAHSQQEDQVAPAPPPESFKAYSKSSEGSNGIIAMMDMLVADLDKEMTTAEADEKNAQEDYETAMADAAAKRTEDSKSLSDRQAAKADAEGALETHNADKESASKELMGTLEYINALHADCDWLMKYYAGRVEARANEVSSLENAKAVLSGADYSLVQTAHTVSRLRGSR